MDNANVNDRASVENVYPFEAFEQDASRNERGEAAIVYGVTILSEPGEDGGFRLARASRHVGEGDPEADTIFLQPQSREAASAVADDGYSHAEEHDSEPSAVSGRREDYLRFIDSVLDAAKAADFKSAIGFGEDRLTGFRGG